MQGAYLPEKQEISPSQAFRRKLVIAEAAIMLAAARLLILLVPFRRWRAALGEFAEPGTKTALPENADIAEEKRATGIARLVRHTAARVPFKAVCLPQAMAARWMLGRRSIETRLFIGARRDSESTENSAAYKFHAWLMYGDICLTGEAERELFTAFQDGGKAS